MRLATCAILFLASICFVTSSESEDATPSLRVLAKSSVYNAGEKKGIYCEGVNLQHRLEWYSPLNVSVEGKSTKNTRVFVERPKGDSLANSLVPLIIHTTKITDSGNWTCRSGNLSETIQILVGEKVNLPVTSEHIEGEEGNSVKLDCTAKGYPLPVVQWYKDTRAIIEDPKKYVIRKKDNNHQLEIKNLTHRDFGEYVCRVTQEALSYYTDKRVKVFVQHKPLLLNPLTNDMYSTKYGLEEVYVLMNETKNITCSALAYPPPSYSWFIRHGSSYSEPITDPELVMHSEDGTSSVFRLRVRDDSALGEYECNANNSKGLVAIVFHVSLGNKPNPPDSVSLVTATTDAFVFNVSCSLCNFPSDEETALDPKNLPVSEFVFQMVVFNNEAPADWDTAMEFAVDALTNDTTYTVGPLPNNTVFQARMCSRNLAGDSEWIDIIPNPKTDHAIKLIASVLLLIVTVVFTQCY